MIMTIIVTVSDVFTSIQFTSVPLRPIFTGAINNVDTSGRVLVAESREKVNLVSSINIGSGG
jgi:hypothetical protein